MKLESATREELDRTYAQPRATFAFGKIFDSQIRFCYHGRKFRLFPDNAFLGVIYPGVKSILRGNRMRGDRTARIIPYHRPSEARPTGLTVVAITKREKTSIHSAFRAEALSAPDKRTIPALLFLKFSPPEIFQKDLPSADARKGSARRVLAAGERGEILAETR
jgi:hypothetical protein